METNLVPEKLRRHEIAGRVEIVNGHGGLPLVKITTPWSTAEIYLHGAHVSHFQKNGEPPLIFMGAKSFFAPGKPIRGGVPICYPWFGNREGEPSHGFARLTEWQLVKTAATPDGAVTVAFALPQISGREAWKNLRTEFAVTVGETLTMELTTANESCGETMDLEECLHTYFHVGDISAVTLTGLEQAAFLDFASGANGATKPAENVSIKIGKETNRSYFDTTSAVEIRDEKLKRTIRVDKFNSKSTVVWNPWTTQKMPEDWGANEHLNMVCVESGNVKSNKLSLGPGKSSALKVVIGSVSLK
jgi:D-hexose-6-phosphate mutarotase